MIYELEQRHFDIFKDEARKWLAYWGLTEWEVFFVFEPNTDGSRARCYTKHLDKICHLALNTRPDLCEPPSETSIRKSAFHEVLELLLSSLTFIALDEEIPHDEREGLTESETHAVIRRMEKAMFTEKA